MVACMAMVAVEEVAPEGKEVDTAAVWMELVGMEAVRLEGTAADSVALESCRLHTQDRRQTAHT